MLPMFDKKRAVGSIMSMRGKKPAVEVASEVEAPGSEMDEGLKAACEDLLGAIERKSVMDMAKAFQAAFLACEEEPHVEGEHIGEEEQGE